MADLPISGLPAVVTPALTDEFATAQGGTTKKYTGQQIVDLSVSETTVTNTVAGPWAAPQSFNLHITKIGTKKVIITFPDALASATLGGTIATQTAIPVALRPAGIQSTVTRVIDNGQSMFGIAEINTSGIIVISVGAAKEGFTGISAAGNTGAVSNSITYDLTI